MNSERLLFSFAFIVRVLVRVSVLSLCLLALPVVCCAQDFAERARQHFEQAQAAQRSGDFATAEKEYLAFLKIAPKSGEAYSNLGVIYARQSRFAEAIQAYEKALQFNPALTPIYLNLGMKHTRS